MFLVIQICISQIHMERSPVYPLALCRTWFGLVRHIVEDCIDEEFDMMKESIKDERVNEGSALRMVTKEDFSQSLRSHG